MKTWGSTAAVIAALQDEAAAEIERLERDAAAALDALRATLSAPQEVPDARTRLDAARKLAAEHDADETWEDVVEAAKDRDAWIVAAAERGRREIAADAGAPAWTARLAREAIRALPGAACVLTVPAAHLTAANESWRADLERATGKRITIESGPLRAGCIARTPDGRVAFDNSIEARDRRTQAAWRAALARVYDAAVSVSTPHAEEQPAEVR